MNCAQTEMARTAYSNQPTSAPLAGALAGGRLSALPSCRMNIGSVLVTATVGYGLGQRRHADVAPSLNSATPYAGPRGVIAEPLGPVAFLAGICGTVVGSEPGGPRTGLPKGLAGCHPR